MGHEAALHVWPDGHAPQVAPPVPHDMPDCETYVSHVPPAVQQPLGQVLASHAQVPLVVSHRPLLQGEHAAPPVPHWVGDWVA